MYRDSQHGLTIDLAGPDGNAFALMGHARRYAKQLGKDANAIVNEMMTGDYDHLVGVFDREFGCVITLLNKPDTAFEPGTCECPDCEGDGHYLGDECERCNGAGEVFL